MEEEDHLCKICKEECTKDTDILVEECSEFNPNVANQCDSCKSYKDGDKWVKEKPKNTVNMFYNSTYCPECYMYNYQNVFDRR